MTALLPPPELQFCDQNGQPYAGGSLYTYVPGTTTPLPTWQDAGQTTLNTNPIILDTAGRAIVYGSGAYRFLLQDQFGNTVYDQLTAEPAGGLISTFAGPTGAQQIGYLAPYPYAVLTTVYAFLNSFCSASQFGYVGDGVHDDTFAIQVAIYSGAKLVYIPSGTPLITGQIVININGVTLYGAGRNGTILQPNFPTGDVLHIGVGGIQPSEVTVEKLGIETTVNRTSGALIRVESGHNTVIRDIFLGGSGGTPYDGINFEGGTTAQYIYHLNEYEIQNCTGVGIGVGRTNVGPAGLVQDMHIGAGIVANCAIGVEVENVSGFYAARMTVINSGTNALVITPAAASTQTAYAMFFEECVFDTTTNGPGVALFGTGPIADVEFTNCWTATNSTHGVYVANTTTSGFMWLGGRSINNKQHGLYLAGGIHLAVHDAQVFCNSQTGSGVYNGIEVFAGIVGFTINDCHVGLGGEIAPSGNLQGYGIHIEGGAGNFFSVQDNIVTGNVLAGIRDDSAGGAQKVIKGNIGYSASNSGQATIAAGQSVVTFAHGLDIPPANIVTALTPAQNIAGVGVARLWVTVAGANMTISADAVASGALIVNWIAGAVGQ